MKYIISKKTTGPLYLTESDDIKMNYRCKAEEQNGTGPGSCGGKSSDEGQSQEKVIDSNKSVMTEQKGRNRFVVTSADGKKYAFRDKDFAKLAMDRLNSGKQIDDIIKRHDELYKTIGNAPRERINPETGLPTMMKDGYEMEYSTEGGKKIWKRTARDLRKV